MHMCVLAWVIHYVPFFFMERQLFLHHYLPAMLFVYATMYAMPCRAWRTRPHPQPWPLFCSALNPIRY
jgi:dolichyl-phosphate-mannose--protein O-mannosyl transferase